MGRRSMWSTSIYCGLITVLLLFNTCSVQVIPAGYRVALGHILPNIGHSNTQQQSEHPVGSCPAKELLSAGEACRRGLHSPAEHHVDGRPVTGRWQRKPVYKLICMNMTKGLEHAQHMYKDRDTLPRLCTWMQVFTVLMRGQRQGDGRRLQWYWRLGACAGHTGCMKLGVLLWQQAHTIKGPHGFCRQLDAGHKQSTADKHGRLLGGSQMSDMLWT